MHIYTHKTDGDITDIYKIEQNFDGDEEKPMWQDCSKQRKTKLMYPILQNPPQA